GPATFSITASGSVPLRYQWQHQLPLGTWFDIDEGVNIDMATATGIGTPTLTLTNLGPLAPGAYRVVVTNTCGSVTSEPATLTICIGDADCDGDTDSDDTVTFFNYWDQGDARGDADNDGDTDSDDVVVFFAALDSGC
ncbi:MAG: hypothetical protein PSX37_13560, partial [bacterium]|nr:hypothetical protein [bacterium]